MPVSRLLCVNDIRVPMPVTGLFHRYCAVLLVILDAAKLL